MDTKRDDEFPELLPIGPGAPQGSLNRRDFCRALGLSSSAFLIACRRAPVREAVPLVEAPDDVVPGNAVWYASTCGACPAACGVLVKTRDGRPIKVEGNPAHPVSQGGVCARGQAAVLGLYDADRAEGPGGRALRTTWGVLDDEVRAALRRVAESGRSIRVVAPPALGPTAEAALALFLAAFPAAGRVRHDPLGDGAIAEGYRLTHGMPVLPAYRFDRARVIAGIDADFLGTWLHPVAFTRQYATARAPGRGRDLARHVQLESRMTLTGSNADTRWPIAPSDVVPVLAALAARLGALAGSTPPPARLDPARLDRLAGELAAARGAALVVTGSRDPVAQALAAAINETLGAAGATVDLARGTPLPAASTVDQLAAELAAGGVGAVIFLGTNPVHDHPRGVELAGLLARAELVVSTADRRDETAAFASHLAPDHHAMESWGDAAGGGVLGLIQPVVQPLHDTRSACESLLRWAGRGETFHDFLRARWSRPEAWDDALRRGFVDWTPAEPIAAAFDTGAAAAALAGWSPGEAGDLEISIGASVALGDGRLANNGWLQELPDPISKVTWGNVAELAPATAQRLDLRDGDVVAVTAVHAAGDRRVELPVLVQPGVHPRAVGVCSGYGRTAAGRIGDGVGANVAPLLGAGAVTITPTGRRVALARTQTHDSMEGRELALETELGAFLRDPKAGTPRPEHGASMWSGHAYPGHRWVMAIDLNACTGCSACLVACQAENNVAVVGVDEVRRRREMHWLRIDRYYAGDPAEPSVVHQPMLCQHCENAPCETVCPVLATVHSAEGLNQQVYNRCVGTRYCANNCPTKVRRFNWFEYDHGQPIERLVLNPDVVVRSRGVMEKCSFCVQRIQHAKADARLAGRPLADGDVQTACQQSCPAGAIAFGDANDPTSAVAKLAASGRAYRILDALHIEPAVTYLTKIRNPGESG